MQQGNDDTMSRAYSEPLTTSIVASRTALLVATTDQLRKILLPASYQMSYVSRVAGDACHHLTSAMNLRVPKNAPEE
jgi:hypothetical protein